MESSGQRMQVTECRAWIRDWLAQRFLDDCDSVADIQMPEQFHKLAKFPVLPGICWGQLQGDAAPKPPGLCPLGLLPRALRRYCLLAFAWLASSECIWVPLLTGRVCFADPWALVCWPRTEHWRMGLLFLPVRPPHVGVAADCGHEGLLGPVARYVPVRGQQRIGHQLHVQE